MRAVRRRGRARGARLLRLCRPAAPEIADSGHACAPGGLRPLRAPDSVFVRFEGGPARRRGLASTQSGPGRPAGRRQAGPRAGSGHRTGRRSGGAMAARRRPPVSFFARLILLRRQRHPPPRPRRPAAGAAGKGGRGGHAWADPGQGPPCCGEVVAVQLRAPRAAGRPQAPQPGASPAPRAAWRERAVRTVWRKARGGVVQMCSAPPSPHCPLPPCPRDDLGRAGRPPWPAAPPSSEDLPGGGGERPPVRHGRALPCRLVIWPATGAPCIGRGGPGSASACGAFASDQTYSLLQRTG